MTTPLPRCRCTHAELQHGFDRRGRAVCRGSSVCGCADYVAATASVPARFDERYDPSPEPIDRSIK